MSCENCKDALIEAAASGATPQGELRAHLAECACCRDVFAQEQSLFAAIDDGLHTAANTEVPPSLLPRVRAAADESAVARQRWGSSWFALAGTAAAAALFFAVGTRHNSSQSAPTNSTSSQLTVEQAIPTGRTPSNPLEAGVSIPRPGVSVTRNSSSPAELPSGTTMPEVLVPRDQEVLLASYAQEWGSRKRAPLVAGDVVQKAMVPLEVAPIQITELDVKPLAEGDLQ